MTIESSPPQLQALQTTSVRWRVLL